MRNAHFTSVSGMGKETEYRKSPTSQLGGAVQTRFSR